MAQNRLDLLYPCNDCFATRGQPCTGAGGKIADECHKSRAGAPGSTEAQYVHELCMRFGFGRIMQLASDLWGKRLKDEDIEGGALTVGPATGELVPCVCLEEKYPGTCIWCCGTGTLTKAVHTLVADK